MVLQRPARPAVEKPIVAFLSQWVPTTWQQMVSLSMWDWCSVCPSTNLSLTSGLDVYGSGVMPESLSTQPCSAIIDCNLRLKYQLMRPFSRNFPTTPTYDLGFTGLVRNRRLTSRCRMEVGRKQFRNS